MTALYIFLVILAVFLLLFAVLALNAVRAKQRGLQARAAARLLQRSRACAACGEAGPNDPLRNGFLPRKL